MSEISHYAWTAAKRLMADCQLATFRRDEAARIIQDAMDWAEVDEANEAKAAKEAEVPQRAPSPAEEMDALNELAGQGVAQ